MTLVVTRPEQDAPGLSAALRQRGHRVVMAPLLAIQPRSGLLPSQRYYQAICVTSANGPRSLSAEALRALDLTTPVLAVGAQSAAAAKACGFVDVSAKGGDVHGLVSEVRRKLSPAGGPVLYLSGAETSGDLEGQLKAAGFSVERLITYDAVALGLEDSIEAITKADGVLLYSPRSAKLWRAEMARLHCDASRLRHYCLSAQVAAGLPPNTHISIAATPDEAAMLALLDLASKAE